MQQRALHRQNIGLGSELAHWGHHSAPPRRGDATSLPSRFDTAEDQVIAGVVCNEIRHMIANTPTSYMEPSRL
eukprot:6199870-Pleurochrysis_carterae.AAC.1